MEREQRTIVEAAKNGYASEDAEKALIGSIVLNFDKTAHIVAELTENDFYYEPHRKILAAVKMAQNDGMAVDLITVSQAVTKIDPVGGVEVNDKLVRCVQSAEVWAADSYCRIIKELAARRNAIELVGRIGEELRDPSVDINGILDTLAGKTGDLLVGGRSWMTMEDVLLNTWEYIDKRSHGEIKSYSTGIRNLDSVIGGFFGGELTVIGARPGVGKSVFGMNVALAVAKQGYKVGIVSREMTDIQYGQRILSRAGCVDGLKIRTATLDQEDWQRMSDGMVMASHLPISFLFTIKTVEDLRAEVQRKRNRGELDMLIVDYLQLMDAAQKYKEDRIRVSIISKALKDISTDLNIPVIALAQVKRFAGGARAKMPTLEDLKDSGSIEQDADNVIFLHNPYDAQDEYVDPRDKDYFDGYANIGYTYLCIGIAKQRQGVTGKCCVLFDKQHMRYLCIDRTEEGEN